MADDWDDVQNEYSLSDQMIRNWVAPMVSMSRPLPSAVCHYASSRETSAPRDERTDQVTSK